MRRSQIIALLVVSVVSAVATPLVVHIYNQQRFLSYHNQVTGKIRSFQSRRPVDIPEEQWRRAVDWTTNVIYQDFFYPNPQEFPGLKKLAEELDQKAESEVDLGTLRSIWDQCENACGGPHSYGIRFRDIKLLTKGAITDERLPEVWSLSRCTILDLSGTEITDASIPYLSTLTQLERFGIEETQITDEGAAELQKALPNCKIFR